jgi:hypothetical protein
MYAWRLTPRNAKAISGNSDGFGKIVRKLFDGGGLGDERCEYTPKVGKHNSMRQ